MNEFEFYTFDYNEWDELDDWAQGYVPSYRELTDDPEMIRRAREEVFYQLEDSNDQLQYQSNGYWPMW